MIGDVNGLPKRSPHNTCITTQLDADGSNLTQVTATPRRWEFTPAWSPDRTKIAFSRTVGRRPDDTDDVWISDADGSNAIRITATPRRDEYGLSWQAV